MTRLDDPSASSHSPVTNLDARLLGVTTTTTAFTRVRAAAISVGQSLLVPSPNQTTSRHPGDEDFRSRRSRVGDPSMSS